MPRYKTHLAGGIVVFAIVLFALAAQVSVRYYPELLLATLAGSLFPDIDTKSKGQRYAYQLMFVIILGLLLCRSYAGAIAVSIVMFFPLLVPHRGIFHRCWFLILMPLSFWMVTTVLFPWTARRLFFDSVFFIAGALSHVFLDIKLVPWLRAWKLIRK